MSDRPLFDKLADDAPVTEKPPAHVDRVELTPESEAWWKRWEDLTPYVMKHLVNRTDIYGRYNKDGKPFTAKDGLTPDKITRHFRPRTPADILGLHSTAAEEIQGPDGKLIVSCTSKWVCNDIDHHGEGPAPPENALAAQAWHQRAVEMGFRPLTYQSNGNGGYRILIIFSEPIQASIAFGFIRWLQRDWNELGLQAEPEWFPRQKKIRPVDDPNDLKGACGNWVRLFGRHHKREHHTRFWDGQRALVGNEAIDWLFDHTGDDPALIPVQARSYLAEQRKTAVAAGKLGESAKSDRPKTFDDLALVADALRSLKPMAADYHSWLRIGMALYELGASGLSIWDAWSKECDEKYQFGVCAEKWATFAPASELNGDGLSLGWLFYEAEQAGWKYQKTPTGHAASATAPASWPEDPKPVRYALPPVPALGAEMLPESLRGWLSDIADRVGCPLEFPTVGALTALGIVIGHKVVIRPKRHDDWSVTPNLWGAIVGRPGVLKTPALKESIRPLRRLEAGARDVHEQAMNSFRVDLDVAQARSKAARKELESAAKDKQRSAAELESLARNAASVQPPVEPVLRRYTTSDATVESLGELLRANPNGIAVVRDELTGWLRSLEKPDQGTAKSFYLEAWEGSGAIFQYDRIGRGHIIVPNSVVVVLGGIQPGPLRSFLRMVARGEEADDGLISRFQLFVWPDIAGEWKNVDRWPDTPAKNKAFAVFQALDVLDPLKAGASATDEGGPPTLRFASPAQDLFDSWRDTLENKKLRAPDENSLIESHLAKYRKLMPALALLFHLADIADGREGGPISLASAELAVKWCALLEAHARRIYSCVVEPDLESARALAEKIKDGALPSPFQIREVYRHGWASLDDPHTARRAVGILQDLGWVRSVEIAQTGGAPREDVHIHPRLPCRSPENQNTS
jgi:putative DNA primase/helicase